MREVLKEDARRRKLREASDRLEQAWAQVATQTSVLPIRAHPALHGESLPTYVLDWLDHNRPGEYWRALDVSQRLDKINVPALHISGWYDTFVRGSVDGFLALKKFAASEFARENQYLLAGPWLHIPWGDRIGATDFGPEALVDTDVILLRWFDHWLKGIDNGVNHEPPVRIYVMGGGDAHKTPEGRIFVGGHWRDEQEWPLARTVPTPYYLHANGVLSPDKPAEDQPITYQFDPRNPVPTLGGNVSSQGTLMFQGAADQRCSRGACSGVNRAAAARRPRGSAPAGCGHAPRARR
jgi:putative CocE/NonD family hydrolase